jgi:ankyrin repeat protein
MKKLILLLLAVSTILVGCSTFEELATYDDPYDHIILNIDNFAEMSAYLEKADGYGTDIDTEIRGGDSILMLASRYSTNLEIIKKILTYNPDINLKNRKNGLTALDYLIQREDADDIYDYLLEQSYKKKVTNQLKTVKDSLMHNLIKKI